jgi:hypothetical protein
MVGEVDALAIVGARVAGRRKHRHSARDRCAQGAAVSRELSGMNRELAGAPAARDYGGLAVGDYPVDDIGVGGIRLRRLVEDDPRGRGNIANHLDVEVRLVRARVVARSPVYGHDAWRGAADVVLLRPGGLIVWIEGGERDHRHGQTMPVEPSASQRSDVVGRGCRHRVRPPTGTSRARQCGRVSSPVTAATSFSEAGIVGLPSGA